MPFQRVVKCKAELIDFSDIFLWTSCIESALSVSERVWLRINWEDCEYIEIAFADFANQIVRTTDEWFGILRQMKS